uniref:hypothetical protein n=1 Tax=Scytothamnus australis TaxID=66621 RepID=UPI002E7922BF|nr:hypothetical protein V2495_pgp040 [Scytothamnus australis]WAM64769.1 hypothetical protein [Scytothamnus australis]
MNIIETLKMVALELYWGEIFLFILFFLLGFILDQKFSINQPRKWFLAFNGLIIQRVLSLLAYYIPYLDVVNTYIPLVANSHPYLVRIFLPNFVIDSVEIVQQIPFLSFLYLMVAYGIFVRYKIPKDRLVRFNIMYGVIIISFQGILHEIFTYFTESVLDNPTDKSEAALLGFLIWLLVFIPCFSRALLGKYESNAFMREAIEVHLGRDGPDFIWWDRVRKDKSPKKPKK